VRGTGGTWWDVVPGTAAVESSDGVAVLELADGVDPQRVLDVARAAGDVLAFTPVRPTLGELFREVVM
jgi:ABC-2 type transport system ATP-binding protein